MFYDTFFNMIQLLYSSKSRITQNSNSVLM